MLAVIVSLKITEMHICRLPVANGAVSCFASAVLGTDLLQKASRHISWITPDRLKIGCLLFESLLV